MEIKFFFCRNQIFFLWKSNFFLWKSNFFLWKSNFYNVRFIQIPEFLSYQIFFYGNQIFFCGNQIFITLGLFKSRVFFLIQFLLQFKSQSFFLIKNPEFLWKTQVFFFTIKKNLNYNIILNSF